MACQVSSPISPGGVWRKDSGWGPRCGERGNPFALSDFLSRCLSELETFGLSELLLPISIAVLMLSSLLQKLYTSFRRLKPPHYNNCFELVDLVGKYDVAMTEECPAFFPPLFLKEKNPNKPPLKTCMGFTPPDLPFFAPFVLPKTCSPDANGVIQREFQNKGHGDSMAL